MIVRNQIRLPTYRVRLEPDTKSSWNWSNSLRNQIYRRTGLTPSTLLSLYALLSRNWNQETSHAFQRLAWYVSHTAGLRFLKGSEKFHYLTSVGFIVQATGLSKCRPPYCCPHWRRCSYLAVSSKVRARKPCADVMVKPRLLLYTVKKLIYIVYFLWLGLVLLKLRGEFSE
jgi:hypothetical protein